MVAASAVQNRRRQLIIAGLVSLTFAGLAILLTIRLFGLIAGQSRQKVVEASQAAKTYESKYKDLQKQFEDLQQLFKQHPAGTVEKQPVDTRLHLAPGCRAMTIPVDSISGVAGALSTQQRVDVLVTVGNPGNAEAVTRLLMQDVPVLFVGPYNPTAPAKASHLPTGVANGSVTLSVSPSQASMLAMAVQTGKIHLVIRDAADHDKGFFPAITQSYLIHGQTPHSKPKPTPPSLTLPPPPANPGPVTSTYTMEVFRGNNSETQTFQSVHPSPF